MQKDPGQDAASSLAEMRKFLIPSYLIATTVYLIFSLHYFTTGLGGTMLLAVTLVPMAYVLWILNSFVAGELPYPRLGLKPNIALASLYIAMCIFSIIYMRVEFDALIYDRAGFFNTPDKIVGLMMLGLVIEYTRREHGILFYLILFLMLYSVYGWVFPGILFHPGVSWTRVITSSSIEITLGLFGTYSQTGVGVIAAFFMFLGIAQGFGVQESIVKTFTGIFAKRKTLIPQTAVVTSMAIATCSGSGAANAAITGQYTIPLMKRAGFPALHAGAVEASASLGGLLMPPVMAIAGFLMADFLGVTYFEVIARGYAPALIFFGIISISVYLFTARFVRGRKSSPDSELVSVIERFSKMDVVNTGIFFAFIGVLIYLMGVLWFDASRAALDIAVGLFITASVLRIYLHPGTISDKIKEWGRALRRSIEAFAGVTAPLILLLAMHGATGEGRRIPCRSPYRSGVRHWGLLRAGNTSLGLLHTFSRDRHPTYDKNRDQPLGRSFLLVFHSGHIRIFATHLTRRCGCFPYFRGLLHEDHDGHATDISPLFLPHIRDFQLGYFVVEAWFSSSGCSVRAHYWMRDSSCRHPR
jgi:TRAP-type uncharacterized transport system fused permease subunit